MSSHKDEGGSPFPLILSIKSKKKKHQSKAAGIYPAVSPKVEENRPVELFQEEIESRPKPGSSRHSLDAFLENQQKFEKRKQEKLRELREIQDAEKEMTEFSSHQPSITKKSQSISRNGKSVYQALYESTSKTPKEAISFDFVPSVNASTKEMIRDERVDKLLYKDAIRRQNKKQNLESPPEFTQSENSKKVLLEKLVSEINKDFYYLVQDECLNYMNFILFLENSNYIKKYSESKKLVLQAWQLIADEKGVSRDNLAGFLLCVMNLHTDESLGKTHFSSKEAAGIHKDFRFMYDCKTTLVAKKETYEAYSFQPTILEESERLAENVRQKRIAENGSFSIEKLTNKKTIDKLEKMKADLQEKEVQDCTFKPSINKKSQTIRRKSYLHEAKKSKNEDSITTDQMRLEESLKECYFSPQLFNPTVKTAPKKQIVSEMIDRLSQPRNPVVKKNLNSDKPTSKRYYYPRSDYMSPMTLVKGLKNKTVRPERIVESEIVNIEDNSTKINMEYPDSSARYQDPECGNNARDYPEYEINSDLQIVDKDIYKDEEIRQTGAEKNEEIKQTGTEKNEEIKQTGAEKNEEIRQTDAEKKDEQAESCLEELANNKDTDSTSKELCKVEATEKLVDPKTEEIKAEESMDTHLEKDEKLEQKAIKTEQDIVENAKVSENSVENAKVSENSQILQPQNEEESKENLSQIEDKNKIETREADALPDTRSEFKEEEQTGESKPPESAEIRKESQTENEPILKESCAEILEDAKIEKDCSENTNLNSMKSKTEKEDPVMLTSDQPEVLTNDPIHPELLQDSDIQKDDFNVRKPEEDYLTIHEEPQENPDIGEITKDNQNCSNEIKDNQTLSDEVKIDQEESKESQLVQEELKDDKQVLTKLSCEDQIKSEIQADKEPETIAKQEEPRSNTLTEESKSNTLVEENKTNTLTEEPMPDTLTEEYESNTLVEEPKSPSSTEENKTNTVTEESKSNILTEAPEIASKPVEKESE